MSIALLSRPAELQLRRTTLTYPEVGHSLGRLPAGYHHIHRRRIIGARAEAFTDAAQAVFTWRLHERAGLRPLVSSPTVQPAALVLLRLGIGRLAVSAPCRVVGILEEPRRRGFAYGTLPGHPEQGEEAFVVEHADNETVILTITAFSRAASPLAHACGPVGRLAQRLITDRYLNALRR